MRRIVHLSDIHFGRAVNAVVDRVVERVNEIGPDIVVVSGDLTQRARRSQFIEARNFLDRLPKPQIVVPGNHDVPLYNVFARFVHPLENFRKYITDDLFPIYLDEELAVAGLNSARSLTIKDGRINERQIAHVRENMCGVSEDVLKVVVTHHPFDLPEGHRSSDIVGRAGTMMPLIAECGAEVLLSGHLHVSHIVDTAKRYKLDNGRSALVVQAGTAASDRGRGELNSFNLIEFEQPTLAVTRLECATAGSGFRAAETSRFTRTSLGWRRDEP